MIILAPIDYGIIAAAFAVLVVRLLVEFREVAAARSSSRVMRTIVKQNFSPLLTVILPLESLEATKQTITRLQNTDTNLSIVVAIHSTEHPHEASKLRYYIKKHAIKKVRVVTSKKLNIADIVKQRITSGLVVVLPDTAVLKNTFYYDAILPFGDTSVDAVRLQSSVRPDKTLASGFEALFVAWRNYFDFSSPRISAETLTPGVILRVKHLRKQPKRKLKVVNTQKAVFSTNSHSALDAGRHLLAACTARDFIMVLVLVGSIIAVLINDNNLALVAGVFGLLYGALVWWSLGSAGNNLINRLSLTLLAPFFFIGLIIIATLRFLQMLAHSWVKGYRLLRGLGKTRNRTVQYTGK